MAKNAFSIVSLFFLLLASQGLAQSGKQPTSSVLSNGSWYKLGISSSRLYKLTRSDFDQMGFNTGSLDPRKIQIYGNGGGMLPQANSAERFHDLEQKTILVVGEEDGSFDANDYVLFYAEGPHTEQVVSGVLTHTYNLYAEKAFCFVTVGAEDGVRVEEKATPETADQTFSTFSEYRWHEEDNYNLLTSGRFWYGESFEFEDEHRYAFSLADRVSGTDVELRTSIMAQSAGVSTSFEIFAEGQRVDSVSMLNTTTSSYGIKGRKKTLDDVVTSDVISGSNLDVSLEYHNNGNESALGFVDFIGVNYERELKVYSNATLFTHVQSTQASTTAYQIQGGGSGVTVWDITDPTHIQALPVEIDGNDAIVKDFSDDQTYYLAFTGSSFPQPELIGSVANQNLHGITTAPDLLIVYHPDFKDQTEELAQFKREVEGYTVEIANIFEVYNEFSSGAQDVSAVRDFARMLYQRNTDDNTLKYLLLIGDASYDYKDRVSNNTNFIPIYESRESLHNVQTYSSDDYFGFLDDNEGEWVESSTGNHSLDIGVGRFVCQTPGGAADIVNKIKHYVTNASSFGNWRNEIAFVADDGDGVLHMDQADQLCDKVEREHPEFNVNKIFLDAFEQVSSAGGEVAPEVNQAINEQIDKGALLINYTGHGGEIGWTQELILNIPQLQAWDNLDRLPLFVTATCEFGRYDDPDRESGAEILLKKGDGGAIALVTTTRPVYSSSNFNLNTAFYNVAFSRQEDSLYGTIGDIIKETKNNSLNGVFNRNFSLLGDPSLRLSYPEKKIVVTEVNGVDVDEVADTVNALGMVTMKGEVQYFSETRMEEFDGVLTVTIYDKRSDVKTLGNEGKEFDYSVLNNIIYEGKASVNQGAFEFTFVVPKDISYNFDYGKVSLYAQNSDGTMDASGANQTLIIGGSASNIPLDNEPPKISLFMDDTTFVSGGSTGSETVLLAFLSDENGINTANSGIGHEITATLDGDKVFVLNDFYTSSIDDFTSGTVEFNFRDLEEGWHEIEFKVWDTHNNSGTSTIRFYVGDMEIFVSNAPNPFSDETTILIDQAREGEELEVQIEIYDAQGAIVLNYTETFFDSPSIIKTLVWDGSSAVSGKLSNGIYFYRTTLRYASDGFETSKLNSLVLIN